MTKSLKLMLPILLFVVNNIVLGQWTSNGWVNFDPSGLPPAGYVESGNCAAYNPAANHTGTARMYNNANVNMTTTSFSFTFDLNFGSDVTLGDGFSFVIMVQ